MTVSHLNLLTMKIITANEPLLCAEHVVFMLILPYIIHQFYEVTTIVIPMLREETVTERSSK